jgi:hypothetical protein
LSLNEIKIKTSSGPPIFHSVKHAFHLDAFFLWELRPSALFDGKKNGFFLIFFCDRCFIFQMLYLPLDGSEVHL